MTEPLMDFQCYVGKYEIKRFDEVFAEAKLRPRLDPPNMPYLVEAGSAKLIRPPREHLEGAVGWLVRTPISTWGEIYDRWLISFNKSTEQIGARAALERPPEIDLDP